MFIRIGGDAAVGLGTSVWMAIYIIYSISTVCRTPDLDIPRLYSDIELFTEDLTPP